MELSIVDETSSAKVPAHVLIRDRLDKDHILAGENGVFWELFDMAEYCCITQVKASRNKKYKVCLSEGAISHLLNGLSLMFGPAGGWNLLRIWWNLRRICRMGREIIIETCSSIVY